MKILLKTIPYFIVRDLRPGREGLACGQAASREESWNLQQGPPHPRAASQVKAEPRLGGGALRGSASQAMGVRCHRSPARGNWGRPAQHPERVCVDRSMGGSGILSEVK